LLYQKQITHATFLNVATTASGLGDFEWCNHFIQKYEPFLVGNEGDNAKNLSLATMYFFKKEFNKTITYLKQCEYITLIFYYKINSLYLRTYYELMDTDQDAGDILSQKLTSFEAALNRNNEATPYKSVSYKNFIFAVKTLYKLRLNPNLSTDQRTQMKQSVLNKKPIGALKWIKEKLEQL
jgi:hypothetical protein